MSADDSVSVWERPEPSSRAALAPLSRERIVRAAIDLADGGGLAEVSLRKVAAALDAGPMRLYGYVDSKDELLDLMVDAVQAEVPLPSAGDDWRATVRALARRTRDLALSHEWLADLLGGRAQLGPAALATLEATLAALGAADAAPPTSAPDRGSAAAGRRASATAVTAAADAVGAYVLGAVRREVSERRAHRASGRDERAWQAASGPYLRRMLATGRYPALAAVVADAAHPDPAAAFDAGLELVLDGIAARGPAPAA